MAALRLADGGIIANYRCPAACEHCLYGCGPNAEPGYITAETARTICDQLRRRGCSGVHIGGGEPFLDIDGLVQLIDAIVTSGLSFDYLETNAAWITGDTARDNAALQRVRQAGAQYIMVSADPFHIAFVPFWKPIALVRLLTATGTPHFIWQQRYWSMLAALDPHKTYTREALHQAVGFDAAAQCVREYGMGFNGRALKLLRAIKKAQPAETFLTSKPCASLRGTHHYHVDLLGRYVPPGCTGLGIPLADLDDCHDPARYPVAARLIADGLSGLWEYALSQGFAPSSDGYVSNCDLCFAMRKFLVRSAPEAHPELSPRLFYEQDF